MHLAEQLVAQFNKVQWQWLVLEFLFDSFNNQ